MELAFVDEMLSANEAKTNDELYEESSNDPLFYGLPHTKQYPMPDEKHVKSAIKFFNYVTAEDEEELARNINKQIKHFKMDDINVGDGNRFKQYYKPATEGVRDQMPKQAISKAKQIFDTAKRSTQAALKNRLSSMRIKSNAFKFQNSWASQDYDNTADLKRGMINMTIVKVDIGTYISEYKKNKPFTDTQKIEREIQTILRLVSQDVKRSKELNKLAPFFNIGYMKFKERYFVLCIEWSFGRERMKHNIEKTKAGFNDFKKSTKNFVKELKNVKPVDDMPEKNQVTDLFGSTYDSDGEPYSNDDNDDEFDESFDSVMTATAPIVPYSKKLTKTINWR